MKNARQLLTDLGIGQFNATMVVPYMMLAPRTTDPKSAPVILMVQHVQRTLYRMGATDVPDSGRFDSATVRALEAAVGPDWERMSWGSLIAELLRARDQRIDVSPQIAAPDGQPIAVSGVLDFLPDVPGGLVTYGVIAFLAYRHFSKKRR